jgi:Asp-tRNA(Asn)/Glu-tRNA(Gln) amidotransferase A subunit family amidase
VSHPQDLGLREQAQAIADGSLDAGELLDATLERIAERDGELTSTPVVFAREARAMLAAAPGGPLRGVPLTLKDMFSTPWRGAHNGTSRELLPPGASGVFERLRDAGAVIVGVAQQHELGMGTTGRASVWGPGRNPHDLARCAGGSSGGSASAVAARLVAGSVGSDSGGSTRIPAAYCGVVGLKTTWGSVPRHGYTGGVSTFSAAGAFGRDAGDARLLAEVLAARPLPAGDGAGLRCGIVRAPFWDDLDPEVEARCREAVEASGWDVVELELDRVELCGPAAASRLAPEFLAGLDLSILPELDPATRALTHFALLTPATRMVRADRVRAHLRRETARAFGKADVLAWPTSPAPPPLIDAPVVELPSGTSLADPPNLRQATLGNLTGVPGISVPVGEAGGLPVGLQLLAPWGAEARLLDAAAHLEGVLSRPAPAARTPTHPG